MVNSAVGEKRYCVFLGGDFGKKSEEMPGMGVCLWGFGIVRDFFSQKKLREMVNFGKESGKLVSDVHVMFFTQRTGTIPQIWFVIVMKRSPCRAVVQFCSKN